ncbi:MAG: SRPBCC family protein [Gammaproteobacteria bacterium]
MFDIVLIVIAALITMFVIIVALKPPRARVSRSAMISAPVSEVFNQVNDLRNWPAWSPWMKLDPAVRIEFDGASAGTGAIYRWHGNQQIGEGNMTILESRPDELIRIRIEFVRPYPGANITEFSFENNEGKTLVIWTMTSYANFITRAIALIVNMEKAVGVQFEQGLENIRSIVEGNDVADGKVDENIGGLS